MYKIKNNSKFDTSSLFISKHKSDIKVECEEGRIKAHKLILETKCKYFKILFSENFSDNKQDSIFFEDVSYNSLNETLRYVYCGKCNFDNFNDLLDCLVFANRIEYVELENELIDMIDPTKLNKDENVNDIVKKLLDIKNINEEIISKKITVLSNNKEYTENDQELQKILDNHCQQFGLCCTIKNPYLKKDEKFQKLNKKKIYVFPTNTIKHDWMWGGKCHDCEGTICKFNNSRFNNKLFTENTLKIEYSFLKKYNFDMIFYKKETEFGEIYFLENDKYLHDKIENEIVNMRTEKYMKQ